MILRALASALLAATLFGACALVWCAVITSPASAYHAPIPHVGAPTAASAYRDRYVKVPYGQPPGYSAAYRDVQAPSARAAVLVAGCAATGGVVRAGYGRNPWRVFCTTAARKTYTTQNITMQEGT